MKLISRIGASLLVAGLIADPVAVDRDSARMEFTAQALAEQVLGVAQPTASRKIKIKTAKALSQFRRPPDLPEAEWALITNFYRKRDPLESIFLEIQRTFGNGADAVWQEWLYFLGYIVHGRTLPESRDGVRETLNRQLRFLGHLLANPFIGELLLRTLGEDMIQIGWSIRIHAHILKLDQGADFRKLIGLLQRANQRHNRLQLLLKTRSA